MSKFTKIAFSNKDQSAQTPLAMMDIVQRMYGVRRFFDPCPSNYKVDGLTTAWKKHNYVNPPFGAIAAWVTKIIVESARGKHTVLLAPLRPATKYTHNDILPHCKSVIIWLNSVRFLPYSNGFSFPIVTYEFGPHSTLSHIPGLTLYRIKLHTWQVSHKPTAYHDDLLPKLQQTFGNFDTQSHCTVDVMGKIDMAKALGKLSKNGRSFVCVMNGPGEALNIMCLHCQQNPNATVVAMVIPGFNSAYMCKTAPFIRRVIFMSPTFKFGGNGRSVLGSVILVLGKDINIKQPVDAAAYLAKWKDGETIGDPSAITRSAQAHNNAQSKTSVSILNVMGNRRTPRHTL